MKNMFTKSCTIMNQLYSRTNFSKLKIFPFLYHLLILEDPKAEKFTSFPSLEENWKELERKRRKKHLSDVRLHFIDIWGR